MINTVHAATSALIGKHILSAPLAFVVAFLFHFVLDVIPHGDQRLGKKILGFRFREMKKTEESYKDSILYAFLDHSFLAIFFIPFMFRNYDFANTDAFVWAIIGGVLPDILVGAYILGKFRGLKWFFTLHTKIHHIFLNRMKADIPLKVGLLVQILIVIAIVVFIDYL